MPKNDSSSKPSRTEVKKTNRILDLILWLAQNQQSGISRERIVKEYGIDERTFRRDISQLRACFPERISYDAESRIVHGDFPDLSQKVKVSIADDLRQNLEKKINIFDVLAPVKNERPYILQLSSATDLLLTKDDLAVILEAIIQRHLLRIAYREKQYDAWPLFFCYYPDHWYLVVLERGNRRTIKLRADFIQSARKLLTSLTGKSKPEIDAADMNAVRQNAYEMILHSKNVFVDLSGGEALTVELKFYMPYGYLKKELPRHERMEPDGADTAESAVRITFSGMREARVFLNKWLGSYAIIGPADFKKQYIEDLKEIARNL